MRLIALFHLLCHERRSSFSAKAKEKRTSMLVPLRSVCVCISMFAVMFVCFCVGCVLCGCGCGCGMFHVLCSKCSCVGRSISTVVNGFAVALNCHISEHEPFPLFRGKVQLTSPGFLELGAVHARLRRSQNH